MERWKGLGKDEEWVIRFFGSSRVQVSKKHFLTLPYGSVCTVQVRIRSTLYFLPTPLHIPGRAEKGTYSITWTLLKSYPYHQRVACHAAMVD